MDLDPRTTAFVAVHMLRDIVAPDGALAAAYAEGVERRRVVPAIGRLLRAARAAGSPVVYTRVVFRAGHADLVANCPLLDGVARAGALEDGRPGAEIIPELAPADGDLVVDHQRVTGFHGSPLDVLLRGRGATAVVLAGVSTNISVEGTAREAVNLGYRTVIAADACSTTTDAAHRATLETFGLLGEVATVDEIVAALQARQPA